MGKSCEGCCVSSKDQKEVIIGQQNGKGSDIDPKYVSNKSIVKNGFKGGAQLQQNINLQTPYQQKNLLSDDLLNKLAGNMGIVIKMQAWARGNKARKEFQFMRSKTIGSNKYFTYDETQETYLLPINADRQNVQEQRPIFTFKTGATYQGEWIGHKREGNGTQIWQDGALYQGHWKDNKAQGLGKFDHIDGDVYIGEWDFDKANGFGVYNHANGGRYVGNWKSDQSHGFGHETWADSSKYIGAYSLGRKNGFGQYQWKDGSKYVGNWEQNKITGVGIYDWLDGRSYQGEWVDNNMQGMGIYKWNDGREFQGAYLNDNKHGYGIFTWFDGRRYAGYWAKGRQHGLGIYSKTSDNKIKFGLWEDGKIVKWFDEQQKTQIDSGSLDYTQYFGNQESAWLLPKFSNFKQPPNFLEQIDTLITRINVTRKTQSDHNIKTEQIEQRAQKLLQSFGQDANISNY